MEKDCHFDENESENFYDDCNDYEDESGWGCYDEFGGYMGYDDFTINSAFDGDPEAVWNID